MSVSHAGLQCSRLAWSTILRNSVDLQKTAHLALCLQPLLNMRLCWSNHTTGQGTKQNLVVSVGGAITWIGLPSLTCESSKCPLWHHKEIISDTAASNSSAGGIFFPNCVAVMNTTDYCGKTVSQQTKCCIIRLIENSKLCDWTRKEFALPRLQSSNTLPQKRWQRSSILTHFEIVFPP